MATVVLDLYSKSYPFIANRIRAAVFAPESPLALIATIIDSTSGHPERTWSFTGLPRRTYGFTLDEIDGSDNVVRNLAIFSVVPGTLDNEICRDDEQIRVNFTPGLIGGTNTFIFDGSETAPSSGIFKPDYRGWEIVTSELTGRGILAKDLDYSWNSDTAEFILLQNGDQFSDNTYWNIHFNCQSQTAGNSTPTITDFEIFRIIEDISLNASHFGKKMLIEHSNDYIEVTLPNPATVPQGRRLYVESISNSGDVGGCARFLPFGSEEIKFSRGKLFILPNESFSIYCYSREGTFEWRVCEAFGNFINVGQMVSDDMPKIGVTSFGEFNKIAAVGHSLNILRYARLYDYVSNLPLDQVCNYDDWNTGNNRYKFSLANSLVTPDEFIIPDRRGLYERAINTEKSGDYLKESIKKFWPGTPNKPCILQSDNSNTTGPVNADAGNEPNIVIPLFIDKTLFGTETNPNSYIINKYFLL